MAAAAAAAAGKSRRSSARGRAGSSSAFLESVLMAGYRDSTVLSLSDHVVVLSSSGLDSARKLSRAFRASAAQLRASSACACSFFSIVMQ